MAVYTTELRSIVESINGITDHSEYADIDRLIDNAAEQIFEPFPIYDENHRSELIRKIVRHYWMREIGSETFGLFKLWLNNKMLEIMPFYNEMYRSAAMEYDPFKDTDYTREGRENSESKDGGEDRTSAQTDSKSNTNATGSGTTYDLYSDTPQGALNGVDSEKYLTNARKDISESSDRSDASDHTVSNGKTEFGKTNESGKKYSEHVHGKMSGDTYMNRIQEFRKAIVNIDMLIIAELSELFMNIW